MAENGYDVQDVGGVELNPDDDFPQFAQAAALKVIGDDSKDPRAILICDGGQGMYMAANRFKGIRASAIWDAFEAKMTRNDNDSNVLCLPARILEYDESAWKGIVETWLNTPYANAPRFIGAIRSWMNYHDRSNYPGDFGSAVAEILSQTLPVKVLRIGVNDQFGESGTADKLWQKHGLDVESIVQRVKSIL